MSPTRRVEIGLDDANHDREAAAEHIGPAGEEQAQGQGQGDAERALAVNVVTTFAVRFDVLFNIAVVT